ncbi:glycosyltransferase, family 2 [Campylobacter blaseri]|uniref:glycosyltransferase family 2 protein n=1 Tax=Campylobacter blaseri TaxID=2042961 RepID=UPI0012FFFA5E|nr:glycosyltransferase family 2 protein [Campylobacter blaseri]QKF86648.1 glycosyltransferase, family 2 [Campylobacter blaseri]
MYDISIIVPIYNTEKYIEKCLVSLFEQDYDNIEYIFVNDKTMDNSMQILSNVLKRYPNREKHVKIINKLKNEGLGQARKTGFENSTGKYIIHIDSDDWCELDMISSLYSKAKEENADIVCCDYFENYSNKEIYVKQNLKNPIKNSTSLIYKYTLWPMVWLYLAKKDLYKNVEFADFSYAEDNYLTTQLFYCSKKSIHINFGYYHYNRANEHSLTKKYDIQKEIDGLRVLDTKLRIFFKKKNIWERYKSQHFSFIIRSIAPKAKMDFFKAIEEINPDANSVKHIIKDDNLGIIKKAFYSLIFIKMLWLFCLAQDLKTIFKKSKL